MHGHIASMVEQRMLNLLGKQSGSTSLAKRQSDGVARGRDLDQFDFVTSFAKPCGDEIRLPQSQGALSGSDPDVHGSI
jgi:hypothetical protein